MSPEFLRLGSREPMVHSVEVFRRHLLRRALALGGNHLCKGVLQPLHSRSGGTQFISRAALSATDTMKHQSRVIGHIERLAAQRDDGSDGCGDAVNVYGYVSLRCREGIEYRYA